MAFSVGDIVEWKWGNGRPQGEVVEIFTEEVELTIKGSSIKRKATEYKPAYLIRQGNGAEVLKSVTEIEEA